MDNSLHRALQGLVTLLDRINKPLCRIQFLFHELHRISPFSGLVGLIAAVVLKHLLILPIDTQIRNAPVVHAQGQFPIIRLHQEIGYDLAHRRLHRIAPITTRLRVQQGNLPNRPFQLLFRNLQQFQYPLIALTGKILKVARQDPRG